MQIIDRKHFLVTPGGAQNAVTNRLYGILDYWTPGSSGTQTCDLSRIDFSLALTSRI